MFKTNHKSQTTMNTQIEIIRTDETNHKAIITGLENDKVIVNNLTLKETQEWDLEDLKQCLKFTF